MGSVVVSGFDFSFCSDDCNSVKVDIRIEGEDALFRASDVAKCLGYSNPANFLELLEIDNLVKRDVTVADGRVRQVPFLVESQLYEGLMLSRAPNASKFRKWVCSEVLPSIRKTGSYSGTQNQLPQTYIQALEALVASEKAKEQAMLVAKQAKELVDFLRIKTDWRGFRKLCAS